jgi:hypothetical protein
MIPRTTIASNKADRSFSVDEDYIKVFAHTAGSPMRPYLVRGLTVVYRIFTFIADNIEH